MYIYIYIYTQYKLFLTGAIDQLAGAAAAKSQAEYMQHYSSVQRAPFKFIRFT